MWSSTSAVRLTGWVCRVHNSRKFTSRPVNESDLVHSISGEIRRKQTAAQLLRLIAGRPLEDKQREKQLLAAVHFLPATPVPARWLTLARDVQHDGPQAVRQALGSITYPVPDVECASESRCTLTARPAAKRFLYPQLNRFLAELFEGIPNGTHLSQLPKVALNRFDLFHAHLFCTQQQQLLGLLFHTKEYPAYDKQTFPVNLGFCQQDSALRFSETAMNLRNMIWFQGRLCALDVGPASVLHQDLIMDGLQDVRTVLESDFGQPVIDVNYFASLPVPLQQRLFLC